MLTSNWLVSNLAEPESSVNVVKLNAALKAAGYLEKTDVTAARLEPYAAAGIAADIFRLSLTYSDDQHPLPNQMIVKRPSLTDRGAGEVEVYQEILSQQPQLPVLTCFAVVDDDPATGLNLLFEDFSESHYQTPWPVIPPLHACLGAVTTLASVHATWWGETASLKHLTPAVEAHQNAEHLSAFFAGFVDLVGEYLSTERRRLFELVLADIDGVIAKRLADAGETMLHTDSHFWNFLYPKAQGPTVIFDWPLWRTGLAGNDLGYMIGLHLYPEHRSRFETPLLNQYQQVLARYGVERQLEEVQLDYHYGLLYGLLMPVMEFSWGVPPDDWIPKMEKAFSAVEALNCSQLLRH